MGNLPGSQAQINTSHFGSASSSAATAAGSSGLPYSHNCLSAFNSHNGAGSVMWFFSRYKYRRPASSLNGDASAMPARERPSIFSAGNPRNPDTNFVRSAASTSSNFTDSTCANCSAVNSPAGHCKAARTAASSGSGQTAGPAAGARNATAAGAPQCGHAAAVVLSGSLHSAQMAILMPPA